MGKFVSKMKGVSLTPLKIIENPKGDIMHVLKCSSETFKSFGEAYFSSVKYNEIKGWKKHTRMQLNIVVLIGEIEFYVFDERKESNTFGKYFSVNLSTSNYQRLTIEPGLFLAFKGMGDDANILLNIASIEHDANESENKSLEEIELP